MVSQIDEESVVTRCILGEFDNKPIQVKHVNLVSTHLMVLNVMRKIGQSDER